VTSLDQPPTGAPAGTRARAKGARWSGSPRWFGWWRRLAVIVVLAVGSSVALAGCGGVVGSVANTETAINNAGFSRARVTPVDNDDDLSVTATSSTPPTPVEVRTVAGIVWHQFHLRFGVLRLRLDYSGTATERTFSFGQLQSTFGARNPAYNRTTVRDSLLHIGIVVIVVFLVLVIVVAVVVILLVRRRRRARRAQAGGWAGPGPPGGYGSSYGSGGYPGYGAGGYGSGGPAAGYGAGGPSQGYSGGYGYGPSPSGWPPNGQAQPQGQPQPYGQSQPQPYGQPQPQPYGQPTPGQSQPQPGQPAPTGGPAGQPPWTPAPSTPPTATPPAATPSGPDGNGNGGWPSTPPPTTPPPSSGWGNDEDPEGRSR